LTHNNRYTYEWEKHTTTGGTEIDVVVPHPTQAEKRQDEFWGLMNPCNCFDKARMIPYNLCDEPEQELWGKK